LRFYLTNVGINGGIQVFDANGNKLGNVPPVSSAFISCTTNPTTGASQWVFVSAETEIACQLRAVIMTAYFNQGQVSPGVLEMNCKIAGCTYTALQFALAKS